MSDTLVGFGMNKDATYQRCRSLAEEYARRHVMELLYLGHHCWACSAKTADEPAQVVEFYVQAVENALEPDNQVNGDGN